MAMPGSPLDNIFGGPSPSPSISIPSLPSTTTGGGSLDSIFGVSSSPGLPLPSPSTQGGESLNGVFTPAGPKANTLPPGLQRRKEVQAAMADPVKRSQLHAEINNTNPGMGLHPINVFDHPVEWAGKTLDMATEPLKTSWQDMWDDPSWWKKPFQGVGVGLNALSVPFNIPTSAINAAAGFDHAPTLADSLSTVGAHLTQDMPWYLAYPLGIATEGVGLAADLFANPVNTVTFGAKPLYTAAQKVTEAAPWIKNLVRGASSGEEMRAFGSKFRYAKPFLSHEDVVTKAAPMMVRENLTAAEKAGMTADPLLNDAVFGAGRKNPIPSVGRSYEEILNDARGELKTDGLKGYHVMPETVKNSATPLAERIKEVARHEAKLGEAIWNDRPRTRVLGVDIGPSPTEALRKRGSAALGKWRDVATFDTPIAPHLQANPVQRAHVDDWLTAINGGTPLPLDQVTSANLVQLAHATQVGVGKLKNWERTVNLFNSVNTIGRWIIDQARELAPADRARAFDQMEAVYKTLHGVLSADSKGVYRNTIHDVEQGLHAFQALRNNPVFQQQLNNVPIRANNMAAVTARMMRTTQTIENMVRNAHRELNPLASAIPGSVHEADLLAQVVSATGGPVQKGQDYVTELTRQFMQFWRDYDLVHNAKIPYPFGFQNRMMKMNVGKTVDAMASDMAQIQTSLRKYLYASQAPITGLETVGKSLGTKAGRKIWTDMAAGNALSSRRSAANLLTPVEAQQLKADIVARIGRLGNRGTGTMTAADKQALQVWVTGLNEQELGNLVYGMSALADMKVKSITRARLLESVVSPLKQEVARAEQSLTQLHAMEHNAIMDDFARHQAQFEPHKLTAALYKPNGLMDRIDRLREKTFKGSKFPQVHQTLIDREEQIKLGKITGEEYGNEVTHKVVAGDLGVIDPARYGSKIPPKVAYAANEAMADILGYETSLNFGRGGAAWQAVVRAKAAEHVQAGEAKLLEIFGGDAGKVAAYRASVTPKIRAELDKILERDTKLGMGGMARAGYFPYKIIGDPNDIQKMHEIMDGQRALYTNEKLAPLMVKKYGPEITRHFNDMAEVEAFIDRVNAQRTKLGEHPLNVELVRHVGAQLGERLALQEVAIANRKSLALMQSIMPGHIQNLGPLSAKAEEDVRKVGWMPLSELIPSMPGWYVHRSFHDYLARYAPAADREAGLWGLFTDINQYITKLNVSFSLVHAKNLMGLAVLAGVNPMEMGRVISSNLKRAGGFLKNFRHPIEALKYALDKDPEFVEAVQNGLSHFRGSAEGRSAAENILEAGRQSTVLEKWKGYFTRRGEGPFTMLIFDVLDRAAKLSLYKQLKNKGLNPHQAADLVNYHLIDYSAKYLNPAAKRVGFSLFPFFGWHMGNAMLHVPNIIENPRMYAMVNYFRQFLSNAWGNNPYAGLPASQVPSALALAVATPWTYSSGYSAWIMPQLPQDSFTRLYGNLWKNPMDPQWDAAQLMRFMGQRTRLGNPLEAAFNPYRQKQLEKESMYDFLFGSDKKDGYVEDMFWGLLPMRVALKDAYKAMWDPSEWENIKHDAPVEALNMFVNTVPVAGGGKHTRIVQQ